LNSFKQVYYLFSFLLLLALALFAYGWFSGYFFRELFEPPKDESFVPASELSIELIDAYSGLRTTDVNGEKISFKSDYYLVKGYFDNEETENLIDEFVCDTLHPNWEEYIQYTISFYKESPYTNLNRIDKGTDLYDHDEIFKYVFSEKHGLKWKTKYKEGKSIKTTYELNCIFFREE